MVAESVAEFALSPGPARGNGTRIMQTNPRRGNSRVAAAHALRAGACCLYGRITQYHEKGKMFLVMFSEETAKKDVVQGSVSLP